MPKKIDESVIAYEDQSEKLKNMTLEKELDTYDYEKEIPVFDVDDNYVEEVKEKIQNDTPKHRVQPFTKTKRNRDSRSDDFAIIGRRSRTQKTELAEKIDNIKRTKKRNTVEGIITARLQHKWGMKEEIEPQTAKLEQDVVEIIDTAEEVYETVEEVQDIVNIKTKALSKYQSKKIRYPRTTDTEAIVPKNEGSLGPDELDGMLAEKIQEYRVGETGKQYILTYKRNEAEVATNTLRYTIRLWDKLLEECLIPFLEEHPTFYPYFEKYLNEMEDV